MHLFWCYHRVGLERGGNPKYAACGVAIEIKLILCDGGVLIFLLRRHECRTVCPKSPKLCCLYVLVLSKFAVLKFIVSSSVYWLHCPNSMTANFLISATFQYHRFSFSIDHCPKLTDPADFECSLGFWWSRGYRVSGV